MSLYPFLEKEKLLQIFGKDIFENRKLLPTMRQLVERGELKPFECVGTKRESKKALALCIKKAQKERKIPYLLSIDLRF